MTDAHAAGMEDHITLGVLDAVHANESVTQRSLSRELGIALGLTNSYFKRCIRKGLIKVKTAPANRYAYYLTPKGFGEKSRLTAAYLSHSFRFFGQAREQMENCFRDAAGLGWRQVALCGVGDLAEIGLLVAMRHRVKVAGIVDADYPSLEFLGLPVTRSVMALGAVDAAIVTDLRTPQETYEALCRAMPAQRVMAPALLRVSRKPGGDAGGRPL